MHYTAHTNEAFASLVHIMADVKNGYLMRYMHANGASLVFIFLYLHIGRTGPSFLCSLATGRVAGGTLTNRDQRTTTSLLFPFPAFLIHYLLINPTSNYRNLLECSPCLNPYHLSCQRQLEETYFNVSGHGETLTPTEHISCPPTSGAQSGLSLLLLTLFSTLRLSGRID